MKEQFDKKLVEKIKDSFSKHEEPFDPIQWEKLSKAYFNSKNTFWQVYWPLITTGIAASLLLIFLFGPFSTERKSAEPFISDSRSDYEPSIVEGDYTRDSSHVSPKEKPTRAVESIEDIQSKVNTTPIRPGGTEGRKSNTVRQIPSLASQKRPDSPLDQPIHVDLPQETIAEDMADYVNPLHGRSENPTMQYAEAMERVNEWLAENGSNLPVVAKKQSTAPLKLGVMVSPQAISNATGGMNLGAGVMSEFPISTRLKLDVGVNYARQRMMPDRSPNIAMEMATYASSSQKQDMQNIRTSSNFIGSELHLNFASLDIPVNLKYRVMDRKNIGIFVITGLSSIVYLDQQATETFQTNSFFTSSADGLSFAPSVQSFTSVYSPEGAGNSVDVGGMLNLSVGYEYNLSGGMFISFEPFYKLPLGSLTFASQQFSIAGINLRMNFNLGK
jgi:hypothetical protein